MTQYSFIPKQVGRSTMSPQPTNTMTCLLSDKTINLLNYRINQEELSSRIYLAMSVWADNKSYFNAAKLWKKYSDEEFNHANWAREVLLSFNKLPCTDAIGMPPNEFTGLNDLITQTLEHETLITLQCKELLQYALTEDLLIFPLAQKYVAEQVEEMRKAYDLVSLLENYGTDKLALALLDHELEGYI